MKLNADNKDMTELKTDKLTEIFGDLLEFNKDLAQFSSYKTGGKATLFISVTTIEELSDTLKKTKNLNIPYVILGGGTNVLISDSGFDGLIIKMDIKGMEIFEKSKIICGAGENLEDLIIFSSKNSLTGLEFAAGIVGSVGGAVYGNAGAYGGEIGNIVESVTVIDKNGEIKNISHSEADFGYRDSVFKKTGDIITQIIFQLEKGDKKAIQSKIDETLSVRHEKLPYDQCSAGCFFKNIPDNTQPHGKLAAGKLLEDIGAKNMKYGGAEISEKHANIIINTGKATSNDILTLAERIKVKVKEKFGVLLEEEIVKIGKF
ncbi:MAG: hypothetical protein DRP35_00325 [Candidatus Zixiibacteriota bacterium]|nr:MAG: hypothetical protein DRP35_00325 [candidate division Zixibacteria bacterium]